MRIKIRNPGYIQIKNVNTQETRLLKLIKNDLVLKVIAPDKQYFKGRSTFAVRTRENFLEYHGAFCARLKMILGRIRARTHILGIPLH